MSKLQAASLTLLAAACTAHASTDLPHADLPLSFERNQGQAAAHVDFIARAAGYGVQLSPTSAEFSSAAAPAPIRMHLLGANTHPRAAGDSPAGVVNYFNGGDAARWHTGIPAYAKVKYAGVYPGIDLVYYGNQQHLEFDFIVAPGADSSAIAVEYQGVDALDLDAQGELVLHTAAGDLVQHRPHLYQDVGGKRHDISGDYVLDGHRTHFRVGAYDHSRPLVIDPILSYASYLGGKTFDNAYAIAAAADGTVYVAGLSYSGHFKCAWGAGRSDGGEGDAFVARLSRDGSRFEYVTYLGGGALDVARGVAVNAGGQAFVTGYTRSADFPTTRFAAQSRYKPAATQNAFAARLDESGSLVYATLIGGSGADAGMGIALDSHDSAYVTGYATSADFPTTPGGLQPTLAGLQNAFVTKLNAAGTAFQFSTYLGGNDYDFGYGIAVNAAGNAYVTGATYAIFTNTFPTTASALQTQFAGSGDAFVSELSANGSTLVYSTLLGGAGFDAGRGISLDAAGNAYVAGNTTSSAFPVTAGVLQASLDGTEDGFVAKLNRDGSALTYSTYLGGSGNDAVYGIAIDGSGNALVTGFTQSVDFPVSAGALQNVETSGHTPFVAALNSQGSQLTYASYLGGSVGDSGYAIATDAQGSAYVAGYTSSVDFPVTSGAAQRQLSSGASQSAFVAKINFAKATH